MFKGKNNSIRSKMSTESKERNIQGQMYAKCTPKKSERGQMNKKEIKKHRRLNGLTTTLPLPKGLEEKLIDRWEKELEKEKGNA